MKRFSRYHDCHYWKMLTEDTSSVSIKPNGEVKEMGVDPNIEIPELCSLNFKRCPYCGDPLDKEMICYIDIELDTLHYKKKRLDYFVERVLKDHYGEITDVLKTDNDIYLIRLKTKGDGDKIAKSLNHYWEVKSAHDTRHDRYTLS